MEETGASSIILSARTAGAIKDGLSEKNDITDVKTSFSIAAPIENLLETSSDFQIFHHIASSRRFVREADQNVLILHSSGTTGMSLCMIFQQ